MSQVEVGGHIAGVDVLHQGELATFLQAENLIIVGESEEGLDCGVVRHLKPARVNIQQKLCRSDIIDLRHG